MTLRSRHSRDASIHNIERGASAASSIGSLRPDKSNLLNGKGPINRFLSRDNRRLFAMRLASHDCAADECGPFPHVLSDAFDDRVFGSSIFHHNRAYSTRRIARRRVNRSSACTTSSLSSTASRRCTVSVASCWLGSMYSPRMRLASSTARTSVSWSGVLKAKQLHRTEIQSQSSRFVPRHAISQKKRPQPRDQLKPSKSGEECRDDARHSPNSPAR
jgi:hypothetical protein